MFRGPLSRSPDLAPGKAPQSVGKVVVVDVGSRQGTGTVPRSMGFRKYQSGNFYFAGLGLRLGLLHLGSMSTISLVARRSLSLISSGEGETCVSATASVISQVMNLSLDIAVGCKHFRRVVASWVSRERVPGDETLCSRFGNAIAEWNLFEDPGYWNKDRPTQHYRTAKFLLAVTSVRYADVALVVHNTASSLL